MRKLKDNNHIAQIFKRVEVDLLMIKFDPLSLSTIISNFIIDMCILSGVQ